MNKYEIEECVINAFNNVGIFMTLEEIHDAAIDEIIEDSLTYISFLVELEENFDVEIPDEYLLSERLSTFDSIITMLEDLLSGKDTFKGI